MLPCSFSAQLKIRPLRSRRPGACSAVRTAYSCSVQQPAPPCGCSCSRRRSELADRFHGREFLRSWLSAWRRDGRAGALMDRADTLQRFDTLIKSDGAQYMELVDSRRMTQPAEQGAQSLVRVHAFLQGDHSGVGADRLLDRLRRAPGSVLLDREDDDADRADACRIVGRRDRRLAQITVGAFQHQTIRAQRRRMLAAGNEMRIFASRPHTRAKIAADALIAIFIGTSFCSIHTLLTRFISAPLRRGEHRLRRPPADHQRQDGRNDAGCAGDHKGLEIIALGGTH